MRKQAGLGAAFCVELLLSVVALALAVVTLIRNDWIELVFKVDPDAGNGSLEKVIVGALVVAAVICAWLARTEWRRTRQGAQASIK